MNTKKKKRAVSETLLIITTLIIPIWIFVMFYIVPNFTGFFQAFLNKEGQFTLDNFRRVFNTLKNIESDLAIGFKNTFLVFGINLIKYPLGILVPFFIYKKVPFYKIHRVIFFLPSIIVGVAVSLVISQLLEPTGFIAEIVANWCNLEYTPELLADSRFANKVLIIQMLWLSFPGDLIIWGGTFARIPVELLEAGRIDGTNWIKEFTHIVVPMVWPTICLQMIFMFCGLFTYSTDAFVMTRGEYGTMTFSVWMQLQLLAGSGGSYSDGVYGYMAAVGMCVTAIAVPLGMLIRKFAGKAFQEVEF